MLRDLKSATVTVLYLIAFLEYITPDFGTDRQFVYRYAEKKHAQWFPDVHAEWKRQERGVDEITEILQELYSTTS